MKRYFTLLGIVLLATAPAFAAKVFIDYDRNADLSSYKSFQYVKHPEDAASNQLLDGRIQAGLEAMLEDAGMQQVESGADLLATYHVVTKDRTQLTTTGFNTGRGWGRAGRGGMGMGSMGMSTATTTATTYTDGTLVVDILDPATKTLVWRGSATQTLKAKPEKLAKQIEKAYTKMLHTWQKMRRNSK